MLGTLRSLVTVVESLVTFGHFLDAKLSSMNLVAFYAGYPSAHHARAELARLLVEEFGEEERTPEEIFKECETRLQIDAACDAVDLRSTAFTLRAIEIASRAAKTQWFTELMLRVTQDTSQHCWSLAPAIAGSLRSARTVLELERVLDIATLFAARHDWSCNSTRFIKSEIKTARGRLDKLHREAAEERRKAVGRGRAARREVSEQEARRRRAPAPKTATPSSVNANEFEEAAAALLRQIRGLPSGPVRRAALDVHVYGQRHTREFLVYPNHEQTAFFVAKRLPELFPDDEAVREVAIWLLRL